MTENNGIQAEVFMDVVSYFDAPDGKRYTLIDRGKGQQTEHEIRREEQMQRSRMGFGFGD